ncbi:MAG: M20 family metallopeptidase [Halobacteria archaeon]
MKRTELIELTRRLVEIPSHESEERAGDFIQDWLEKETDADVVRDDEGNVFASRDGIPSEGADLCLVGHHDVVPPDEGQVDDGGYVVSVEGGRVYGRGSADMKSALAAAMFAFRNTEAVNLGFVSFVDEEVGGEGCRYAIDNGFSPGKAVVLEGSTGYRRDGLVDVCVAHKGRRGVEVDCVGEACHASMPEDGVNAVYRAVDAVQEMRALETPVAEIYGRELEVTVEVTGIEGGEAINTVPGECSFRIDERTVPGKRVDYSTISEMVGVEVRETMNLPPMVCDDGDFAESALCAAAEVQNRSGEGRNRTPEPIVKPHASDAGWLSASGVEPVVIGPAEPGEAHTADESISLAAVETCYEIYRKIADGV